MIASAPYLLAAALALSTPVADGWDTYYETSGHTQTPRYDDTVAYCHRLAAASPWITYTSFGTSGQGRQMPLVILDGNGNSTPEAVRASGNVVVMIQAGIHAGEIDGKDAGLMLFRDIAIRRSIETLARDVTILFIPIFNVDGHERFGPFNRPNQNGPDTMGWRVTANNLNLNRDYLKADTPEMRAWTALFVEWLPEFFVDCHVTDGADHQYVLTYGLQVWGNIDSGIAAWTRDDYLPAVDAGMRESGFPIFPYVWARFDHAPFAGITSWAAPPRYSEGYTAIHNRPGLLLETHVFKDYKTRVTATYEMLRHTIAFVQRDRDRLQRIVADADRVAASADFRRDPLPLAWETGYDDSTMLTFLGIDYDVVKSDVTGADWIRFSGDPVTRQVPYFDTQTVSAEAMLPELYIVPPEWQDVISRLELNGVRITRLREPRDVDVEMYYFENPAWESAPYEGRHRVTFDLRTEKTTLQFPSGSALVDMSQRAARVVANALEPKAYDSYASWGFFDAVFEAKEYIESYKLEEIARQMLADDAKLRAEFDARKHDDPEFAADPVAIRQWFYERTPYFDTAYRRYPVARVVDPDVARTLRQAPQRAAE